MAISGSEGSVPKYEMFENAALLLAATAFLALSIYCLYSVLEKPEHVALRFGLGATSFAFGLICITVSPANQGRTLRRLLDRMTPERSSVNDIASLQRSVGSAGFFNRIGLTGIPLAVALLALVFCGLSFLAYRLGATESVRALLDLTKLTVGAFIGSLTKKPPEQEQKS